MSRRQYPAGRPPLLSVQAGAGSAGSVTAHSASDMSEGYRGVLVLRLIPPGQHRHATAGVPWACAGSAGSLICTNRDRGTRAHLCRGTTRAAAFTEALRSAPPGDQPPEPGTRQRAFQTSSYPGASSEIGDGDIAWPTIC